MSLVSVSEIFLCACLVFVFYVKQLWYWKKKNIAHVNPMPLVGNLGSFVFQTRPLAYTIQDIYSAFPKERYVGFHKLLQPALLIKDPELIKLITIRDWHSFSQHSVVVSEEVDPLWGYSVVAMRGDELWRQMRSILSFAFTSSKLKNMFGLMKICSQQFVTFVEQQEGNNIIIDMKEAFSKYTNDVIATTAFGYDSNSFDQPSNGFYIMGKDATDFEGFKALKFLLNGFSPYLMQLFRIGIYTQTVKDFFYKVIKDTLRKRKKDSLIRPDMIHLMMQAKEGGTIENHDDFVTLAELNESSGDTKKKLVINDDIITAQALIFFIGGFDSTSTVMSFTAYELACNLDVQKILRQEVDAVRAACNGDITYEALMDMKYLDMVVSESLRKWPSILISDRAVVKRYTFESKEEHDAPLTIDTDVCCAIPIYCIHRDPEHYPDPDRFYPERFSEQNKVNIKPYTYLPFGSGPRGCIGSRFALLEIKLIITELVHKFEILPTAETEIPMTLNPRSFLLRPKNGIILALKRREGV